MTKKLSLEFSRTESRILGALSKLDEILLNPQARTCSVAAPGTSRNNYSENWEPTGERSLDDPCSEVVFSYCNTSSLSDSEQEEPHHTYGITFNHSKKYFFWISDENSIHLAFGLKCKKTSAKSAKFEEHVKTFNG